MSWNPTREQEAIIAHDTRQHGRVLAGPGTGKSATVIRMLLEASRDSGSRGKLLTFTRAATNELGDKTAELGDVLEKPSTIHSFAIATLLANPGTSSLPEPLRIADDWEWDYLIRHHLKVLVGCSVRVIDRAVEEMASNWESLNPVEDPDLPAEIRNRFSGIWAEHRSIFGYSLLAELPFRLLRALEDHPTLTLGDWDTLVVDEYQDLNRCDLDVLQLISRRGYCLLVAGDDDQSIYGFRARATRRDSKVPERLPRCGGLRAIDQPPVWHFDSEVGAACNRGLAGPAKPAPFDSGATKPRRSGAVPQVRGRVC